MSFCNHVHNDPGALEGEKVKEEYCLTLIELKSTYHLLGEEIFQQVNHFHTWSPRDSKRNSAWVISNLTPHQLIPFTNFDRVTNQTHQLAFTSTNFKTKHGFKESEDVVQI